MKARNQNMTLLVELLIAFLFFMLAATVLLQVFAASSRQTQRAGILNDALVTAQNVADRFCAAADDAGAAESLQSMGFETGSAEWTLGREAYTVRVTLRTEERAAGIIKLATITACQGDDVLLTLPAARYEEAQP